MTEPDSLDKLEEEVRLDEASGSLLRVIQGLFPPGGDA